MLPRLLALSAVLGFGAASSRCGCGSALRPAPADGSWATLPSPAFPNGWLCNGYVCSWLLVSPDGASPLTLSFPAFLTEGGYDVVSVYDGPDGKARLLARCSGAFCGTVRSSGPSLMVEFSCDGSTAVGFAGFNASFRALLPPTTPAPPDLDWWKEYPIYQVYPRSFQDSDGDGTGDLQGIISRLDYLSWLGIRVIWLNPIYDSPMKDFGYDVSNYTHIDPLFGTMADFDQLVAELHSRGMHLVMDIVPNHSSDQHPWFQKSLQGIAPYDDYYVWKPLNSDGSPINNWLSVFGNSSWEYAAQRDAAYLHQFLIAQPDLNYRSADVRREMEGVLEFWMAKGVDGFRIDAIIFAVENGSFADEPRSGAPDALPNQYDYLRHTMTIDQPATYDVVKDWVALFRDYGTRHRKHIFNVYEGYTDIAHVLEFYDIGADFPFNFDLVQLDASTTPQQLGTMVRGWMSHMSGGRWPNWVMGNHDNHRIATRMGGTQFTDAMNMVILLLPGTPTVYYGDELGMTDVFVPFNETKDPAGKKWGPSLYLNFTRDPERTPMQWDASPNAGFTKNSSGGWLPVPASHASVNVAAERGDPRSHLSVFRKLLALRLLPAFQDATNLVVGQGDASSPVFAFARKGSDGRRTYVVALSLGHGGGQVALSARDLWDGWFRGQLFNALAVRVETASGPLAAFVASLGGGHL